MIKKLDKLILKSFIGPFIVTFFIALFVLIMQTLWKYIDDLVGKGLDFFTIIQFVWYASATLLTLAMPIAILISSIMTFGNLGESFELVAIKSSGISLLRFMRPLMWFTVLLCFTTFIFANYVIPYSQLKFVTLYKDILLKKPSLDLKQGQFYTGIEKYAIRVGKKNIDGKQIEKVLIYDQTNTLQENTIVAQNGKMEITSDNNYLAFNLKNGTRYQEKGNYGDSSTEYIKLEFETFKKLFDVSIFKQKKGEEDQFKNNSRMLSVRQLNKSIDSIAKVNDSVSRNFEKSLATSLPYLAKDSFLKYNPVGSIKYNKKDSIFADSATAILFDRAIAKANELKNTLTFGAVDLKQKKEELISHKIEWQRKFSFSLACMVLFFIGAPLGSIIRKGGMGMPLVVAIIFFLAFHLLNMFGEKFARNDSFSPFAGMWFAVILLTPVGIFLTYKATNDSQLFNKEFYTRLYKKVKQLFPKKKIDTSIV
ncbi:MAG: LptF/LptG family permease [Ferruginibacter sp.]|nr:YjgP/YjgQ family permease [Ferruginibacter sp.]